ncbi:MAG TPA: hypothetical protein GXX40_08535 [Firmicutes bacterium]|nr:hypothetical protein [Bacillota bacterium]
MAACISRTGWSYPRCDQLCLREWFGNQSIAGLSCGAGERRGWPHNSVAEASYVYPSGRGFQNEVGIYLGRRVPGLRSLADAVHAHGVKIAVQLRHGGRQAKSSVTGHSIVVPFHPPCSHGRLKDALQKGRCLSATIPGNQKEA